jgi:hypothetical protein
MLIIQVLVTLNNKIISTDKGIPQGLLLSPKAQMYKIKLIKTREAFFV